MRVQEAIEILEAKAIRANQAEDFLYGDALKLGIEALKRIQVLRSNPRALPRLGLPGETQD